MLYTKLSILAFMLFAVLKTPTPTSAPVDGFELRLDAFPQIDKEEIGGLMRALAKPVIFTLRRKEHGGAFAGSPEEQEALMMHLLSLEPAFVDLEHDTAESFLENIALRFPKTKLILSYHNFSETPEHLEELFSQISSRRAFAYKIACFAQSSSDALRMLLLLRAQKDLCRLIGVSMGEEGRAARILTPIFGGFLTYATLEKEESSIALPALHELLDTYHFRALSASTKIYGLIGNPVARSLSHATHNALFRHHALDAVYVKMRVEAEELGTWLRLAKQCGFQGLSVTTPHKESVVSHLDRIDAGAEQIGAVNTIVRQGDEWVGYNSDGRGALDAIENLLPVKGKQILIMGAGGAAKAIAFEATQRGAHVFILNRTAAKAEAFARKIGASGAGWEKMEEVLEKKFDVMIQSATTSIPIDPTKLPSGMVAMDVHNVPAWTPFLQLAQQKNCRLVFGYEMFVRQALIQYQLWFNQNLDYSLFVNYCRKLLNIN